MPSHELAFQTLQVCVSGNVVVFTTDEERLKLLHIPEILSSEIFGERTW